MAKQAVANREPMAKVDTAWLRMESPTNLMMITGVMTFAAPLGLARLRELIGQRFLAYRRFGQRPVDTGAAAFWENTKPDLRWHVRTAKLPRKADKAALERFVSELASTPLDHARPLWQFHLIENHQGGSVLIARIHHCYADGLALVQVMLSLTDAAAQAAANADPGKGWRPRERGGVISRLLAPARKGIAKAWDAGGALLRDPVLAATMAREGSEIARELAIALNLSDDPATAFKAGPLGARKRCAWAEPLPLAEVRALGKVLRCTVNDILLACAAGALRGYLRDLGEAVDGVTIRATVPVNLRPLEHARQLGNHFGLVFLDLPVGEANPLRRLELIAASMRELKGSKQAALTFGLLAAVGMAQMAVPQLKDLTITIDGKPVALPASLLPASAQLPPMWLAMTDKAIALAAGQGSEATLGAYFAAPPSTTPVFLRLHFTGALYGLLGKYADLMQAAMPAEQKARFAKQTELFSLYEKMIRAGEFTFEANANGIGLRETVDLGE